MKASGSFLIYQLLMNICKCTPCSIHVWDVSKLASLFDRFQSIYNQGCRQFFNTKKTSKVQIL